MSRSGASRRRRPPVASFAILHVLGECAEHAPGTIVFADVRWTDIPGWFQWRTGQEEAARHFASGSRFVEVGTYLGRSLCSLADVAAASGKHFSIVGVD